MQSVNTSEQQDEQWRKSNLAPEWEISNYGKVRKISTKSLATPYISVRVHTAKKQQFSIARLVADAFLGNPLKKRIVDHIDRNPLNNNADNLRYATSGENTLNGSKRLPIKNGIPQSKWVGVSWRATRGYWVTRLSYRQAWSSRDEDLLALHYSLRRLFEYGEFALINDVPIDMYNGQIVW
jgi:hypothetical protein